MNRKVVCQDKLGFVLSGSNSKYASFQPLKSAENLIKEGMFVLLDDDPPYYALISEIRSYHEFYEPGDVWSETIRHGAPPPDEVARKYMVANLQIVGRITEKGLITSNRPPKPGTIVCRVDPKHLAQIYMSAQDESHQKRIKIGSLYGYSEDEFPAYINLENITMHTAIIGTTGSGKSNTLGVIIEELGNKDKLSSTFRTLPIIVIDANGDYVDYYQNPDLVKSYSKIYRFVFPESQTDKENIRNFNKRRELKRIYLDLSIFNPAELAETIISYYHGGRLEGAELQLQALQLFLENMLEKESSKLLGRDLNNTLSDDFYFQQFIKQLESWLKAQGQHPGVQGAVIRAVHNFRNMLLRVIAKKKDSATLSSNFIDEITNPKAPALVILDFSSEGATSVSLAEKQFVIYYLLRLLFQKFTEYKIRGDKRVLIFALEEAQNYAPNLSAYPLGLNIARNILAKVATQGRKFGLSLMLITQRPTYVDPVVMSMMNTFIIHRISPGDIRYVSSVSGGLPPYIERKLTTMDKGLVVLSGQMNLFPIPVLVSVRERKQHIAGKTPILGD